MNYLEIALSMSIWASVTWKYMDEVANSTGYITLWSFAVGACMALVWPAILILWLIGAALTLVSKLPEAIEKQATKIVLWRRK